MNNVITLTWLTFQEARRRRMVVAALTIGLLFLILFSVGFVLINNEITREEFPDFTATPIRNFVTLAGLYVVHFLAIMLAIFTSVDTVSGEITSHTIQSIVTKPIRRWQVILGKWLGYAVMMGLYLSLLSGGIVAIVYVVSGYAPPNLLQGLFLLWLQALVLISLSLLGGTLFSTLTNGVALFMLYGLAFIGVWVEQIGAILQSSAALRVGIVSSLIMPVEALWGRASHLMQPPIANALPSPFTVSSVPSPAMVVYAMVYIGVALLMSMYVFGRRDL
ncbi:MAG: ABC transporter permease [Chloroflexi bacterium AL-N10]|nr:ABC transporter permease [Chloroflexi bacterium AL-N1]NOK69867.1 ABC transporter permease [Chloroflexi bacterium AL-N10]NOK73836.1 ABC transporter permease [Chloroflexi bacterium AL-N5]NOK91600.1 ABC transporter permease [Chloroflexi bacterium AL-N15]